MKKKTLILTILFIILTIFININEVKADDITNNANYYLNSKEIDKKIKDNDEKTFIEIKKTDTIKIESKESIVGVYIIYELNSQTGVIEYNQKKTEIGKNKFLHEYIELDETNELTIKYDNNVKIADIYVIDNNGIPSFVEKWEKPLDDEADLLIFATHFDDDATYLVGPIPTYIAQGKKIQVVYYTKTMDDETYRYHEALRGLYKMGVKNYPVFGIIPDKWSTELGEAITLLSEDDLTIDDAINFQVEMIRRFKPEVIVGHDENGEYGHGQHMLNTHTLKTALEKTNDSNYHLDSYYMYGTWNTPKTYLHDYKENQIVLDLDTPLAYYDGKTAYEVSILGFEQHKSQHSTGLLQWFLGKNGEIEKASQITAYSPINFGLYRSLVGEDIQKNDMFENLSESTTNNHENGEEPSKIVIPNLYNTITIILVILAILLYFEMSPIKIYNLLIDFKKIIMKDFNDKKKQKNTETKSSKKTQSKKTSTKKNSTTKKGTASTKKKSNANKTSTKKTNTTTKKKNTSTNKK